MADLGSGRYGLPGDGGDNWLSGGGGCPGGGGGDRRVPGEVVMEVPGCGGDGGEERRGRGRGEERRK